MDECVVVYVERGSMKAVKKKRSEQVSNKYNKGKIGLLFVFGVTVGFFAYFVLSHVLPKDESSSFQPEAETYASGKPTTLTNPVILEAESMSYLSAPEGIQVFDDALASGGSGKMLTISTNILSSVTFDNSVSKITVRAKGTNCSGWPNVNLALNGVTVMSKKITSERWSDFSTRVNILPGSYNIQLTYANDYQARGCNRDVMVDKITFE